MPVSFIASHHSDYGLYDYILGEFHTRPDLFEGIYANGDHGLSIAANRYYYLLDLDLIHPLTIALMDRESRAWTKWGPFPGQLWENKLTDRGWFHSSGLTAAVDVHRSMLSNEIVVESDYPTYEENFEAAKIIGAILEEKGFIPHYYFSGNKSIHIHVFLDEKCFEIIDELILSKLSVRYRRSQLRFKKAFILWLRAKMISCWDTHAKKFDEDLIRSSHLIRAELSKNKRGFKTFLGYTHNDLSCVPYICNENNRIYPRLGEIRLSSPDCIKELAEEFLDSLENKDKSYRRKKMNRSLSKWMGNGKEELRGCVKAILSDDFKKAGDGSKRAMFVLMNELKSVYGESEARIIAMDWNARMGCPVRDQEIESRLKTKTYSLHCGYVHKFLESLGFDVSKKCKGKV